MEELKEVQSNKDDLSGELIELQGAVDIAPLDKEMAEERELKEAQSNKDDHSDELTELLEAVDIATLDKEMAEERELKEARSNKDDSDELTELQEAVDIAPLEKEMADLLERLATFQQENEQLKGRVQELTQHLEFLKIEISKGGMEGVAANAQVKQLEQEISILKEAIVRMNELMKEVNDKQQNQFLQKQEKELHNESWICVVPGDAERTRNAEEDTEESSFSVQRSLSSSRLETLQQENEQLKDRVEELTKNLENLKIELNYKGMEVASANTQVNQTKQQNSRLEEDIVRMKELQVIDKQQSQSLQKQVKERDKLLEESRQSIESSAAAAQTIPFVSRYLADFEPGLRLGKGGFGMVFHAKHKVDKCQYAIKRIRLPNCDEARKKVSQEAKTLAKLEHPPIVRYYNSWFEAPSVGWLEDNKKTFPEDSNLEEDTGGSSADTSKSHRSQNDLLMDLKKVESESIGGIIFSHTHEVSENGSASGSKNSTTSGSSADTSSSNVSENGSASGSENSTTSGSSADTSSSNASENVDLTDSDSDIIFSHTQEVSENGAASGSEISSSKSSSVLRAPFTTSGQALLFGKHHKCKSEKCTPDTRKAPLYLFIQMELCHRNTLKDRLDNTTPIDPSLCLDIFEQIVGAVKYFHGRGVIHRDLKPSNIFFSLDESVKVGDFGLVTGSVQKPADNTTKGKSDANHTGQVGTHLYMSPEQIEGRRYSYKVDVFSLGIIFFELFQSFSTEMERINTIREVRKKIFPKEFINKMNLQVQLCKWMLADSPESRPTAAAICVSDTYKNIRHLAA